MTHIRGFSIMLIADFLSETMEARRLWNDILKVLEKIKSRSQIQKDQISSKTEGEIMIFLDKPKLRICY
jgi:hypothetical protein